MADSAQDNKPLRGIRVVSMEQQVAGPYCTQMLAHQGAEVIKIERPGSGDSSREMAPILKNDKGEVNSGYFMRFNLNKKSITLNTRSDEGREIFKGLARQADVIVENFRPGMMQKLGIGYNVLSNLNPRLIYASISGFGTLDQYKGPYSDRPAYDIVSQAMGGLMHVCGQADGPPTWLGIALGDIYSGVMAAYGITLALIHRQHTGEGQYLDISMYDNMASLAERYLAAYSLTGQVMSRGKEKYIAPWGPFQVKDGYVALIVATESDWAKFCTAIGHNELIGHEKTKSGPARAANMESFIGPIISDWFMQYTKQEVTEILLRDGMPVGPVQDPKEVFECPHIKARDLIVETNDPIVGPVKLIGSPLKLSKSPEQLTEPVPSLGQHTDEVLRTLLGYSAEQIAKAREAGVV